MRREFDHQIVDYANGKPLEEIPGVSFRKDGKIVNNPEGPVIENLDELPWVSKVYKRDLDVTNYNVPFLLNPYISLYTSRGCPAMCTFCLWPQTHSGHRWRLRSADDVAAEMRYIKENFPQIKEVFFDDDTFNYKASRTIELCAKLKPLNMTWSCTSRVTTDYDTLKAMKEAGCRLLIVGYESGDPQILKNIKKGATIDMAERFTANCKKLGLLVHGDFIVGLPGESRDSIRKTIDFAKKLDNETIQVSIAHPYPGTEFYDYAKKNNLISIGNMTDEVGHQLTQGDLSRPGRSRAGRMGGALLWRVLLPSARDLARGEQGDFQLARSQAPDQRSEGVHGVARQAQALCGGPPRGVRLRQCWRLRTQRSPPLRPVPRV